MKFQIIDHADQNEIEKMYNSHPVFVLTTGRSGSNYIVNLLNNAFPDQVEAYHEPYPVLEYFPNYFYQNQDKVSELKNIFNTARMELVLKSFIKEKIYIESNQCLVFLSDIILDLFPNAKFIHLIRNPIDFTISAVKKGWYKNDSIWENGRIRHKDEDIWIKKTHIEKLAWYWNETNQHIENFKLKVDPENMLTLKLEKLTTEKDTLQKFINFCGIESTMHNPENINAIQTKKVNELHIHPAEPDNMKKVRTFPSFFNWKESERERFIQEVEVLAKKYNYSLDKKNYEIEHKFQLIAIKENEIQKQKKIIEEQEETIKKFLTLEKKIKELKETTALKHPIKKYRAYKNFLQTYAEINEISS